MPNIPISIRVDPELLTRVRESARRNRRSVAGEIMSMIEEALDARARDEEARRRP